MENDYSHMWLVSEEGTAQFFEKFGTFRGCLTHAIYFIRLIMPLFNWPIYLYLGRPDGGHLLLFGRLWEGATWTELTRGYMSSAVTIGSMAAWYMMLGPLFMEAYVMPWLCYGWWLFTVTYLQHHFEDMALFV